jgi:hypothetical protein
LGHTKDDVNVKKAVDEVQVYYNAQEKREWVEWAGKTLMPRLHAQMAMEQADAMRAVQVDLDEMQRQDEREQRVEKEAEWEKREAEFIRQVEAKEIDNERFRELVNERAMAESVAEGPVTTQVTTQDEEVGESEWEESAEEEPAVAERAVESSTVGKGKRKAVPVRAKVYAEVDGPVGHLRWSGRSSKMVR